MVHQNGRDAGIPALKESGTGHADASSSSASSGPSIPRVDGVRPFTIDDLPQILNLIRKPYPRTAHLSSDALHDLFYKLFLNNPWYEVKMPSLVHQEDNGRITGFLGVTPRRMTLKGETYHVAIGQYIGADPRSADPAVRLFEAFLGGVQDLSLADLESHVVQKLWDSLDGTTSWLNSYYWFRPLRPSCYALSRIPTHSRMARYVPLMMPFGRMIDAIRVRNPGSQFHPIAPRFLEEELTEELLLECLSRGTEDHWLRPDYDLRALHWLLDMVARERRYGTLQKVVLLNERWDIIGWYLYYLNRREKSRVLQLGAVDKRLIPHVLDHLAYYAWQRGAIALFGRMEPRLTPMTSGDVKQFGYIMPGANRMLVHTRYPDVMKAIHRGEVFLSHLEGDLGLL